MKSAMRRPDVSVPAPPPISRLLTLPAELRNFIYEYVADSAEQVCFVRGHIIAPALQLAIVCQHVRQEFLPIFDAYVRKYAELLHAHILDTNFTQLQTFLHTLVPLPDVAKRALTVHFELTRSSAASITNFHQWVNYCETAPMNGRLEVAYFAILNRTRRPKADRCATALGRFAVAGMFTGHYMADVDAGTLRAGRKKEAKKPIKVRRRWDKVVKEVKKMLRTTSFLAKRKRDEVDEGDLMR